MTKALKKEVEELENQTDETTEENEETQDVVDDEGSEASVEEDNNEDTSEATDDEPEEVSEEDAEKLKKQEAYRERRKAKQEETQKRQEGLQEQADVATSSAKQTQEEAFTDEFKEEVALVREERKIRQFEQSVKRAEKELETLEVPFKEAFTDYDDVVKDALDLTKLRLLNQGASESEADDYLRREKVLVADRAAARGEDPVEAVYNEAKDIIGVFDAFAEKRGYVLKDGKRKTNLQAMREISKPNAMSGGAGKGANAATTDFSDMDDLEEIGQVTLGQMLKVDD